MTIAQVGWLAIGGNPLTIPGVGCRPRRTLKPITPAISTSCDKPLLTMPVKNQYIKSRLLSLRHNGLSLWQE